MWNVIYFSERYVCLFWHKMQVAKAFLPNQWVWGWLRGFNGFATNGIDYSGLTLVTWNKFTIQIIGFMTGRFYYWFYTAVISLPWVMQIGGKHNTVLCLLKSLYNPVLKAIYNFWLLVVLLLNPINSMGCCELYHLFVLGDM